MNHCEQRQNLASAKRKALGRSVRRTLNLRVLSITLIVVSAGGIGTYFWRLHQVSRAADALLARAAALEKQGQLEPAAHYLRRYLRFHPQDDDAFVHLAETVDATTGLSQVRKHEAISLYLGALKLQGVSEKKKSELCARAAELLLDLQDYSSARRQAELLLGIEKLAAQQQLAVDENNPRAQRVLALAWYGLYQRGGIGALSRTSDTDLSIAAELQRALELNPGDVQLATTLSHIYREEPALLSDDEEEQLGQTEREKRADDIMRRMVRDADNAETRFASYVYKSSYGLAGADDDLDEALGQKPKDVNLLVAAAYAKARSGFTEQARRLFDRAVELAPSDPRAYLGLAEIFAAERQYDQALETCRRGLDSLRRDNPGRLNLLSLAAEVSLNAYQQRWGDADDQLTEAEHQQRKQNQEKVEQALDAQADAVRELRPMILAIREQRPAAPGPTMSVIERSCDLLQARWLAVTDETVQSIKLLEHIALSRSDLPEEIAQSVEAFRLLGSIHAQAGDREQAASAFAEAAALKQTSVPLLLAAANSCIKAKRPAKAVSYCRQALSLQDSPAVRFALALALLQREVDLPESERDPQRLEESLAEVGPIVQLVESALAGPTAAVVGELEQAFRSLEGPPGNRWKYCRARKLLAECDGHDDPRCAEAAQLLSELRESHPDWHATCFLQGRISEQDALREQAAEAYTQALQAGAPRLLVYERLLPLLFQLERFEQLARYVLESQEKIIASRSLAPLVIRMETVRRNPKRAVQIARRCVAAHPREPRERIQLGQALLVQGQAEEAEKQFQQAVSLARSNSERRRALNVLFRFFVQTEQRESARETLQELAAESNQSESRRSLVLAQGEDALGNREAAEAHYRQAAKLSPDNDIVQMELVKLLGRTGGTARIREAETLLRRLVQRRPEFGPARQGLAVLLAGYGGEEQWEEAQQLLSEPAADDDSSNVDQRLEALLLTRRGGRQNRQRAREILEQLVADAQKPLLGDQVALARLYERDGQVREADKILRAIAEQKTPLPQHLASYIEFLLRHGEAEAADVWIAKLKRLAPRSLVTLKQVANGLFVRNEASRIEPTVEPVAKELLGQCTDEREKALLAMKIGKLYLSVELDEAARRWYQQMLEVAEPDSRHIMRYVVFLLDHDSADEAAEWLNNLEEAAPQRPETVALKARCLAAQGKGSEVEKMLEPIAAQWTAEAGGDREQEARTAGAVGNIYSSVHLHRLAERWYERLGELSEGICRPLAVCLAKQGRCEEAVRLCIEGTESDRSQRPAIALASVLLAGKPGKEDLARAEPILAQALENHKDTPDLLSMIASIRFIQGRHTEAIHLFEQVLQDRPNDLLALNNLAAALGELPARRDDALRYVEKAIQIAGPRPNLLDTQGTILVRAGKPRQAGPLLEAAASSFRADPRYHLHLAEAYFHMGDFSKARAAFNKACDAGLMDQLLTQADTAAIGELQQAPLP